MNWLRMRNIKWEDGTHALRARRGMKRKLTTCRVEWYLGYLKSLNIWGSLRSDRSWSDIEDCSWKFYIYKWWLVCKSAGAEGAFGKWIRREFARMSCKLGELILSTREFEGTLDRTVVTLWEVLYPVYRLIYQRSCTVSVYSKPRLLRLVHMWESQIRWSSEEERGFVVYYWRDFLCCGVNMFSWLDKKKGDRCYKQGSASKFYRDTTRSCYPKGYMIQISGDSW